MRVTRMNENGKALNVHSSVPVASFHRDSTMPSNWGDVIIASILTARERAKAAIQTGATWGATCGGSIGFFLGIAATFWRGKMGLWKDVLIQDAFGIVLLTFSGMMLGCISITLIFSVCCAIVGALYPIVAFQRAGKSSASLLVPNEPYQGVLSLPPASVNFRKPVERRELPDLALSDPELR